MPTHDWSGAKTEIEPASLMIDTKELYKQLIEEGVSRRVFPAASLTPILRPGQKSFQIWDIYDDLKTNYGPVAANFPTNVMSMRPKQYDTFKIFTKLMADKDLKEEMDLGLLPWSERVSRALTKVAQDEDMYAIAGESTVNGVSGIADTTASTGFSTAATTELDLTTFLTARTTLKGLISQLNAGLKSNGRGLANVRQAPLILLVTEDVFDRGIEMSSADTTTDTSITDGIDLMNSILQKYGGPGSRVEQTSYLGATVSRAGNAFKVTTDGSTNASLISSHPLHLGIASSLLRQTPAPQPNGDIEFEIDERWTPYSVIQEAIITSATVDITA
jgi:hypothetical protein